MADTCRIRVSRWCTRVLKIQPFERFVGDSQAFSYIGIRGDEDREGGTNRRNRR